MIYPRLKVAKDLLMDDGVIFISIGDDEEANLIKVCDEIFGERNFIASICHKHRASVSNDRIISENHNHLLFYTKDINLLFSKQKSIGEDPVLEGFNLEDENGKYKLTPVDGPGGAKKGNPYYEFLGVNGYWRYSKETMQDKYNRGLIVRTPNGLQQKYYLSQAEHSRRTVTTWWDDDFLTSTATKQLADLMDGKVFDNPKNVNLLLRTLKMITKFEAAFTQINANFNKVFKELFGGGRAELKLEEEDNLLECGINIIAEPPGKKLQSITLLSGGERALTAVAILFAILKLRPMPFCVLDEIEAALDDANVERFAKYLKNFSKDTQFIVITHRKPTMELADSLYGVTMEEKGVSKIVSVKLSDAIKQSSEVAS